MQHSYLLPAPRSRPSALSRALKVWALSNLGGTAFLMLDFIFTNEMELAVPLFVGLLASCVSLAYVPLALPFFALTYRVCTSWLCRFTAAVGVLAIFAAANCLLLHLQLLPLDSLSSLLPFSLPYLGAALLAVAWIYRPRPMPAQPAVRLLAQPAWQPRSARWPMLAQ